MYIVVLLINLFLAIFSKKNRIIPAFSFVYLGLLAGQTDLINNRDTFNYYTDYVQISSFGYTSRFEWAYVLCEKIGNRFGLTYQDFRLILVLLFCILLFFCVRYFINNVAMFYVLFSTFAFPLEATQIRTFIMFILIFFALDLVSREQKIAKIAGIFVSFIAPGFHSIGYFFTLLIICSVFFNNTQKIKIAKKIPVISVCCTFLILISGMASFVGTFLSKIVGSISSNQEIVENIGIRFNNNGTLITTLSFMCVCLGMYYAVLFNRSEMLKIEDYVREEGLTKNVNLIFATSFSMLAIPLLTISGQYQRILRYGIILLFVYWIASYEFNTEKKMTSKDLIYILSIVVFIIFAIVLFYGLYSSRVFADTIPYLIKFN